jgi:hypothetical protein
MSVVSSREESMVMLPSRLGDALGIDEARLAKALGGAVIDVFIDVADIAAATL